GGVVALRERGGVRDQQVDVVGPQLLEAVPGGRREQRADRAGQGGGVGVDRVRGGLEVGGVGGAGPQRADDQLDVLAEQLGQRGAQPPARRLGHLRLGGREQRRPERLAAAERVRVPLAVGGVGLLVVLRGVLVRS